MDNWENKFASIICLKENVVGEKAAKELIVSLRRSGIVLTKRQSP